MHQSPHTKLTRMFISDRRNPTATAIVVAIISPRPSASPLSTRVASCLLAIALLFGGALAHAGDALDQRFGEQGMRGLFQLGAMVQALGSCPHDDGSITVLSHRQETGHLVLARITVDGSLDDTFSDDGVADLAFFWAIDPQRSVLACAGVGNGTAEDDRIMLAALAQGDEDTAVLALIDPHAARFDAEFGLGGPMQHAYSSLLFPATGDIAYPRLAIRGVFPGNNGDWIISGHVGDAGATRFAFVARVAVHGGITALVHPSAEGLSMRDVTTTRIGSDGRIRALGTAVVGGQPTWALLRLDAESLQTMSVSAVGEPDGFNYQVEPGRRLPGGLMTAAVIAGDDSPFATAPRLLIVREDTVNELELPQPAALNGETVGVVSATATGAVGGRVVFVASLRRGDHVGVGFHAVVVRLGDGISVPDVVDTAFAEGGSAVFRFRPATSSCPAEEGPPQGASRISAWGEASLLVGDIAPDCGAQTSSGLVMARIDSASVQLFRGDFE